jgi:hypothetical protein
MTSTSPSSARRRTALAAVARDTRPYWCWSGWVCHPQTCCPSEATCQPCPRSLNTSRSFLRPRLRERGMLTGRTGTGSSTLGPSLVPASVRELPVFMGARALERARHAPGLAATALFPKGSGPGEPPAVGCSLTCIYVLSRPTSPAILRRRRRPVLPALRRSQLEIQRQAKRPRPSDLHRVAATWADQCATTQDQGTISTVRDSV